MDNPFAAMRSAIVSNIEKDRRRFNQDSPTWRAYGFCMQIAQATEDPVKGSVDIPNSMVIHSGKTVPDDWDGGDVIIDHEKNDGTKVREILTGGNVYAPDWDGLIIAYTAKVEVSTSRNPSPIERAREIAIKHALPGRYDGMSTVAVLRGDADDAPYMIALLAALGDR